MLLLGVGGTDWAVLLPDAKPPNEGVALTILELRGVVQSTVQPAQLSLWLRAPEA